MSVQMCIFAGCDFLKALPGIGMKKAHQHVKRLKAHRKVQNWHLYCAAYAFVQRGCKGTASVQGKLHWGFRCVKQSGCTIREWIITECVLLQ